MHVTAEIFFFASRKFHYDKSQNYNAKERERGSVSVEDNFSLRKKSSKTRKREITRKRNSAFARQARATRDKTVHVIAYLLALKSCA